MAMTIMQMSVVVVVVMMMMIVAIITIATVHVQVASKTEHIDIKQKVFKKFYKALSKR
jgi:uncharacterized protein YabE (DUF348 family)